MDANCPLIVTPRVLSELKDVARGLFEGHHRYNGEFDHFTNALETLNVYLARHGKGPAILWALPAPVTAETWEALDDRG
jgi:phage-related protein